jgi:hypothetical protein
MSVTTLLISIAVLALIILYFQYKNNKNMENLKSIVSSIQPPVVSTTLLDKNDFLEQNNLINKKLDTLYSMTSDRYEKLHNAIDSIPVIGMTDEQNYSVEEKQDYQGLPFIDMEQPVKISLSEQSNHSIKDIHSEEKLSSKHESSHQQIKTESIKPESVKSKSNSHRSINIELNLHKDNISNDLSKNTDAKYPKLNELRELCKERNLSPYGNKKTLISLLIENGYNFNE